MNKILVYTFFSYSKVTSKGLYEFSNVKYKIDKLFIPNRFATKKLVNQISEYDIVLGIADHNKKALKSRFDPKYINRYSKRVILTEAPEFINSNLEIDLPNDFYIYTSTTNGPCNRSAYLIMNEIESNNLNTKFGFFHLSKKNWEKDLRILINQINKAVK
jgi:hypothetical protein